MDDIPIGPPQGKYSPPPPSGKGGAKPAGEPRRDFMAKSAAVVTGAAITAVPIAAGMAFVSDPLLRSAGDAKFVKVAALAALPDDGVPRQFPVVVDSRDDAWTRFVNEPIGAVFLKRMPGTQEVTAWHATCPHAGCFVGYVAAKKEFFCPCHNSAFDSSGKVVSGPPPRDLDTLECIVADGAILVKFQDFIVGIHDKIVKA